MISRTERATQMKTRRLNLTSNQFLLLDIDFSPDDGIGNEEKADKSDYCEGEPHVANQLSPNDL